MKIRNGFVSNSSSSSFILSLDNNNYEKFLSTLIKQDVTYEDIIKVKTNQEILNYIIQNYGFNINEFCSNCYYDNNENKIIFTPYDKNMWILKINKKLDKMKNCSNKTKKEHFYIKHVKHLENLLKEDPKDILQENIVTMQEITDYFKNFKKYCDDDKQIIEITFRRDGDGPESEIESTLTEIKTFKEFLNDNNINFEFI